MFFIVKPIKILSQHVAGPNPAGWLAGWLAGKQAAEVTRLPNTLARFCGDNSCKQVVQIDHVIKGSAVHNDSNTDLVGNNGDKIRDDLIVVLAVVVVVEDKVTRVLENCCSWSWSWSAGLVVVADDDTFPAFAIGVTLP